MIVTSAPSKHSKQIAKLSMSNSFDLNDPSTKMMSSKAISMPNNHHHDNDLYDINGVNESFIEESGKFSINSGFDNQISFTNGSSSKREKDSNISFSLENDIYLPKPKTEQLMKKIDKKLNSENMVPILILSKSRKILNNKYPNKIDPKSKIDYLSSLQKYELKAANNNQLFNTSNSNINDESFKASNETLNSNSKNMFYSKSNIQFDIDKNNKDKDDKHHHKHKHHHHHHHHHHKSSDNVETKTSIQNQIKAKEQVCRIKNRYCKS